MEEGVLQLKLGFRWGFLQRLWAGFNLGFGASDGRKMMMARLVGFDKNWGFGLQVRVLVWVDGFEWIRIGIDR